MTWTLAPMEGVTTFPTRLFYALTAPPDTMTTPFLRATDTYPHRALPDHFAPEHRPSLRGALPYHLDLQVMAADEEPFERTAAMAPATAPSLELNCGCPSPTCTGKGAGSSLLKEPAVFYAFVERLVRTLGPRRLAVKMRTGYAEHAEFEALLAAVASLPLARLTVHGRTRPQGYTGKARWDLIAAATERTASPVHASGDVVDAASAAALSAAAPKAAGVLVGRGALRHPWIFAELRARRAVQLAASVIADALSVFALLHDLGASELETLIAWAEDGWFTEPLGTDAERWRAFRAKAWERAGGRSRALQRATLGRTKMLWSYWRSSLPEAYFAPTTLRAKTVDELCERVAALGRADVTPTHRPQLDWVYSGRKSEGEACAVSP